MRSLHTFSGVSETLNMLQAVEGGSAKDKGIIPSRFVQVAPREGSMANSLKRMRIYQIVMIAVVGAGALAGCCHRILRFPMDVGGRRALGSSGALMMP